MNIRYLAVQVLITITEGKSLSDALPEALKMLEESRDQALLQAICYGVCRWYERLNVILENLLAKPLKQKDFDLTLLLLIGLYQLIEMRIPEYAVISETVNAVKSLKKIWAKNLVNGVLRNYQRHARDLNESLVQDERYRFSHPVWMMQKIKQEWQEDWEGMLDANNQHPPFTLRVNQKLNTRENYLKNYSQHDFHIIPETQSGFILHEAKEVNQLPGFNAGEVSVQDGAAQLAAKLLELQPKQRVLDACAAPGGKTTHILELQSDLEALIALDRSAKRLHVVQENLQRLKMHADCICADAALLDSWWDGKVFDRILLDAPCSASGVIRRHPDIKLLRRESDITALVLDQQRLLNSLWQALKPNGILLYATCSIFKEENESNITKFMAEHPDASEEKIDASWGKACNIGRQILPGMHDMDGFYFARLRKMQKN